MNESPGAVLDYIVIMTNHIHAIIELEASKYPLGEIIRRFKARVTHELKQATWQANYYEHVIRNELALYRIREY